MKQRLAKRDGPGLPPVMAAGAPARSSAVGMILRPKLRVGSVGGPHEQQADRMADQVMQMPEPGAQADRAPVSAGRVQASSDPGDTHAPASRAETAIGALRGGGQPLGAAERAYFEPRFGRSFDDVRIHTGPRADAAADMINARAFAIGSDIAFAQNQFSPQTTAGKRLIAHELTHVSQSRQAIGQIVHRDAASHSQTRQEVDLIGPLSAAVELLGSAQVQGRGLSDVATLTSAIATELLTGNYGVYNESGQRDPDHSARPVRIFRIIPHLPNEMSRPFEYRVWLFLSHESGPSTPAGKFEPAGRRGGRLVFYIANMMDRSADDIAGLVAHEFFHMFAHYQRSIRHFHGDEAAGQAPSAAIARVIDPTSFAAHRTTMEAHFETLISYLNAQARANGVFNIDQSRPVTETKSNWGRLVVEEVGAYVYQTCVRDAIANLQASQPTHHGPAVVIGQNSEPRQFLTKYITDFWLSDAGDRTALLTDEGQNILANMSADFTALQAAVRLHMGCINHATIPISPTINGRP